MLEIINNSTDPYFNLALEDYLLNREDITEDIFLLWQNRPVVVVGRNQNTVEEINQEFIRSRNVEVVRRISGGGAVYHDLGNLNFTFIAHEEPGLSLDFARYTAPVIEALAIIGIKAENQGRNDITIQGRKFSGNAQCRLHGRVMHHGTILFASDLEDMQQALNVDPGKIISKGVKSVRSRVTNISEHLAAPLTMAEFKDILSQAINKDRKYRELSPDERSAVESLRDNKFRRWEWVYGFSPPFNVRRSQRFDWGNIDFRFEVKRGLVKECKIYGDFFASRDVTIIERQLIGLRYQSEDMRKALESQDLASFIPAAQPDEIIDLLLRG
jgi:lipoate-protein ligase A